MKSPAGAHIGPIAVLTASAVVAVSALGVMAYVPKPTAERARATNAATRRALERSVAQTHRQADAVEAAVRARLWPGDADDVTSALLARVTREAISRGLKLTGFRSQRSQDFGRITELPFSAQVSGPYPAVRSLLASLDVPGTRVALRAAQIASSDNSNSTVVATLGISAFVGSPRPTDAGGKADGTNG